MRKCCKLKSQYFYSLKVKYMQIIPDSEDKELTETVKETVKKEAHDAAEIGVKEGKKEVTDEESNKK